jgi:hypothetical protein
MIEGSGSATLLHAEVNPFLFFRSPRMIPTTTAPYTSLIPRACRQHLLSPQQSCMLEMTCPYCDDIYGTQIDFPTAYLPETRHLNKYRICTAPVPAVGLYKNENHSIFCTVRCFSRVQNQGISNEAKIIIFNTVKELEENKNLNQAKDGDTSSYFKGDPINYWNLRSITKKRGFIEIWIDFCKKRRDRSKILGTKPSEDGKCVSFLRYLSTAPVHKYRVPVLYLALPMTIM